MLASKIREMWPGIVYGKLCFTEKYHISSMPNHIKPKIIA